MTDSGKREDSRRIYEMLKTHFEFLRNKMCDHILVLKTQEQTQDIEQLTDAIGHLNSIGFILSQVKYR